MERPFPAYRGDEPFVFVCYAHEDDDLVYPEIQWLHDQGFNIWYDEGISPGTEWRDELANAIRSADLFLYLVTPNAVESNNCRREVNYALDADKPILAIHLKSTELSEGLKLSLSDRQAIFKHELTDQEYSEKVLSGVASHIQQGQSVNTVSTSSVTATTSRPSTEQSIAVLPFTDLSPERNQQYFVEGLSEEIINTLSGVMKVSARTSAFALAEKGADIQTVASKLGVANVLEGSVRKEGDQIRVTAALIEVESGFQLWSNTYDRELTGVFAIQEEIARAITNQLYWCILCNLK